VGVPQRALVRLSARVKVEEAPARQPAREQAAVRQLARASAQAEAPVWQLARGPARAREQALQQVQRARASPIPESVAPAARPAAPPAGRKSSCSD